MPSLIPLSSSDDQISIEEDLIRLIEDYGPEAFPFTKSRREELKASDAGMLEGGKLEDLWHTKDEIMSYLRMVER
jgi:nucleoredoxin